MRSFHGLSVTLAVLMAGIATPAAASDEAFEFWLNPSVSTDLDGNTGLELETAQRFRSAEDGRVDTYFARLWLNQELSDNFTLSGAVEQRINDGGADERRTIQQLSARQGIWRGRVRLLQRFVHGADRMGLRLQTRGGVAVPLSGDGRWSGRADAELFLTLRSTSAGGDDGLTGVRTQIGVDYEVNDRLTVGLTYLRQQDFNDGAPDEVGHVPLIGVELSL